MTETIACDLPIHRIRTIFPAPQHLILSYVDFPAKYYIIFYFISLYLPNIFRSQYFQ